MALRAKVRGKWRIISPAMARVFRARGVHVEDTNAPAQPQPQPDLPPAPATTGEDAQVSLVGTTAPAETDPSVAREIEANEQRFVDTELVDASQTLSLEFANSSNVRRAQLDTSTGVVTVAFANGTYQYSNFTPELMADWKAAKSAGSWFHHNVRSKPDRHPVVSPVPSR